MRILKQVPGSCLWLKKVSPAVEGRLLSYAEGAGIKRDRIIFAGRMDSLKDHMARYQLADLALDTYPYNGHATSMDALWMGLPVLSVLGAAMHARVSASLLRSVQLDDLIAKDIEAYEKKAVELAQDPEKLKSVKSKLDSAHKKGDVFPMVKYTKSLEQAYRVMVERYRAGRPPDHIEIKG
jgi:predicted O-linked N-acetylglucosamine transferase (SPINDLY family)